MEYSCNSTLNPLCATLKAAAGESGKLTETVAEVNNEIGKRQRDMSRDCIQPTIQVCVGYD